MKGKTGDKTIKPFSLIWYLSIVVIYVALILFTFGDSLRLPLWGDDWVMLWIVKNFYGPGNQFPYLSLKGYFQPWGIMNLFLIINRYFFGYSGYGYYFVSMILRTFSAFAGYLFLSKFMKSRTIGLIGSLFVLVGYTGIESTNYTIHMNTYLVLIFIFLTMFFLINSFKRRYGNYLLGCLFFALGLAASPLRSHGLLPFIIIFDVLYCKTIMKIKIKPTFFRQIGLFLAFLLIYKLKFFGSPNLDFINITQILQMIRNGDYTFISCFITNLGRTYFPDIYTINSTSIVRFVGFEWFYQVVLSAFIVEALVFWYLSKIIGKIVKNYIIAVIILALNFILLIFVYGRVPVSNELFSLLISTFIGIFFLSFLFWALYMLSVSKNEKANSAWVGMVAGPVLILTSLIVPLVSNLVGSFFDSNHRYFTLSLVGVAITYSSILKLSMKNKKSTVYVLIALISLLVVNIKADKKYFSNLYLIRNPSTTYFVWKQFFDFMPKYFQKYPDKLLFFYFDDSEAEGVATNTFLYGFSLRVALEYNIKVQSDIPAYTNIYSEVVSAVTDGKAFRRLGYPEEKIGIDQIYAFQIDKNGELIDITQKTRDELAKNIKI